MIKALGIIILLIILAAVLVIQKMFGWKTAFKSVFIGIKKFFGFIKRGFFGGN